MFLRNAHWGRADTLGRLKRHREALPDWDRAVGLSPPPQRPPVQMGRALSLVRAGETARAAQAAEELVAAPGRPGDLLYDAASLFALASAATEGPPGDRYAARAVELLALARTQGLFREPARVERLKKDPDLAALRRRDGFKKLLAELERAPGPKAGEGKR
jgi:hypothetical protein